MAGTEVAAVLYSPNTNDRQIIVGEPAAGGSPHAQATRSAPQSTPSTLEPPGEATAETTPAAGNPAAGEGLAPWVSATYARLIALQTLLTPIGEALTTPGTTPPDPAQIRESATRIATMAEEQRSANPPPAGKAVNEALANAFQRYGDALNDLADALEANDAAAMKSIATEVTAINATFETGGEIELLLQDLAKTCPELSGILGG